MYILFYAEISVKCRILFLTLKLNQFLKDIQLHCKTNLSNDDVVDVKQILENPYRVAENRHLGNDNGEFCIFPSTLVEFLEN